jgi:hypothetical protein
VPPQSSPDSIGTDGVEADLSDDELRAEIAAEWVKIKVMLSLDGEHDQMVAVQLTTFHELCRAQNIDISKYSGWLKVSKENAIKVFGYVCVQHCQTSVRSV